MTTMTDRCSDIAFYLLGVCGCCSALKPRYKRLVDNIFPDDPQDGLVKSNMEKLTFYGLTSPEKLDRIGDYLAQRLSRDVSRHRNGYAVIAMEALDTLLVTCHAHTLNLFVESFLKMVQTLLESQETSLQILAVQSFVKFANIEEDTPSYHRRYDFFVSKFSAMCHTSNGAQTKVGIRVAGLQGIKGVVRKTVSDDLQADIWEQTHMNKIVPSLLFNMENYNSENEPESPKEEDLSPGPVAENVLRDLVCRASYGNIQSVLKPVLVHLDNHNLWFPNAFAVKSMKIIMYSVQSQYGYEVVKMLMRHLDSHAKSEARVKRGIVEVVSETVLIAAGGSIGPSVLDVFNSLLRHLRISVDLKTPDSQLAEDEKRFQEAIINTIGEFANNLPDYQKIEIIMFIMGKIPMPSTVDKASNEVSLQTMLLKTMLKVAAKYKTVLMISAFPTSFLEPLLRMSLAGDPGMRVIVQSVIHTLLDRHGNLAKLSEVKIPKDISELDLIVEKPSRQDIFFMKKTGSQFYSHICEGLQLSSNKVENFESMYTSLCLLCVELGGEDVIVELLRVALTIQHSASTSSLPSTHKCAIHALVAAFVDVVTGLTAIPDLCHYVHQVLETRQKEAMCYLPDFAFNRDNTPQSYPQADTMKDEWLFSTEAFSEALSSRGYDADRLTSLFNFKRDHTDLGRSISESQSISLSMESLDSSPGLKRRSLAEEITFESLKKVLDDNPESKKEKEQRRLEILETFRTAPFEEIVAKSEAKSQHLDRLNDILDNMQTVTSSSSSASPNDITHVTDIEFPDLFVY